MLCLTTAELLNSSPMDCIIRNHLHICNAVIEDETSQISKPAFMASGTRLSEARHGYIGVPISYVPTAVRAAGGSHSSNKEAQVCRAIVQALLAKGSSHVTCHNHNHQSHFIRHIDDGVAKKTSSSDITPDGPEFIDDKLRLNIAITRRRHCQFLFGSIFH
ncbi:hypothetical protein OESDEN_03523 [Oesophagostomum dentatum]|uniref:DNA2/NAM7 helicase-like C-terminal domain-containing protein n=1 Tax=Oesophagostomum dentatum TaxID=61180 RepID=A0A0B1TL22_OESDE|nr:hypothetical protein OESDEN_03523 [Oesophagostomum dentatum]